MRLTRLTIENLRLFDRVEAEGFGLFNLICGPNASGKTSFLEAIHLLATARSFRAPHLGEVVRHGCDPLRVTAFVLDSRQRSVPMGIERHRKQITMKAAGRRIHRVSELAQCLPVQVIHPDSHQLVSGGPRLRRRFLDWGVFHVEPLFQSVWRRYDKALKQRNAALKSVPNGAEASVWDRELSETAARLHEFRLRYVERLNEVFPAFAGAIVDEARFNIQYHPGWDTARPLSEELQQHRDRDRRRGFTGRGAHRAELVLTAGDYRAQQTVSRGQQKMLVMALSLAQVQLLKDKTGKACVLLIDDLAAELDAVHRARLLAVLRDLDAQVFVTAVSADSLDLSGWPDVKVFHVEHGRVTEVV